MDFWVFQTWSELRDRIWDLLGQGIGGFGLRLDNDDVAMSMPVGTLTVLLSVNSDLARIFPDRTPPLST